MTASITLRSGRDKSVRRRHPWIFSGAVADVGGSPEPGETVEVRAAGGELLGRAAYSPVSQIRARMWTFDGDTPVDAALVTARIAAAASRRSDLLATGTDSARLVFSEADSVPGVIADRYGDTVVCQLSTAGAEHWRDTVLDALAGLDGVRTVHERSDADARRREGLDERSGHARGVPVDPDLLAHEGRWRFAVDAAGGHKTGFYLDQRHARRALELLAPGRRVLNLFAYTGAFSVIAAGSGATAVTSVDSSGPALVLAARNAELNGVDIGELVEADAFSHLRALRDRARQYDLIVLDPPKLASTVAQVDKASRAYKDANLLAVKLLAPGGLLLTFSCSAAMDAVLFQKVVAGAALDARRDVTIEARLNQPSDHPVPLAFPEAEYLKGLVLRAV